MLTCIFNCRHTKMLTEVNNMSSNTIKIYKKDSIKGEDGYKTFSIRVKEETVIELDGLALRTNRSRNELINLLLEHSLQNVQVME